MLSTSLDAFLYPRCEFWILTMTEAISKD